MQQYVFEYHSRNDGTEIACETCKKVKKIMVRTEIKSYFEVEFLCMECAIEEWETPVGSDDHDEDLDNVFGK